MMMKFSAILKEIPVLLRLAWPIVVGQMLFGIIDVVMVGRVGTTDLAAIAFSNSVFVIFLVFGVGVTNATSPLVSRSLGKKDLARAAKTLTNAFRLGTADFHRVVSSGNGIASFSD